MGKRVCSQAWSLWKQWSRQMDHSASLPTKTTTSSLGDPSPAAVRCWCSAGRRKAGHRLRNHDMSPKRSSCTQVLCSQPSILHIPATARSHVLVLATIEARGPRVSRHGWQKGRGNVIPISDTASLLRIFPPCSHWKATLESSLFPQPLKCC